MFFFVLIVFGVGEEDNLRKTGLPGEEDRNDRDGCVCRGEGGGAGFGIPLLTVRKFSNNCPNNMHV